MSGGPRRSTERRQTADVVSYQPSVGAGSALSLSSAAEAVASQEPATPTIVINREGQHVLVGPSDQVGSSSALTLRELYFHATTLLPASPSLIEYSWDVGDTPRQGVSDRGAEPQATVRVLTLNPSGPGFMNPIAVRLAELTRNYPLASSYDWRKMEDALGPVRIFAIESEPVTFDVDQSTDAFTGRARVLADVLDPSDAKTFLESRVLDARVHGRFEDGIPNIDAFEFQNAG